MTSRLAFICLLLPAVILSANIDPGHKNAADLNCGQCHPTCLQPGTEYHLGTDNNGCAYCHHWTVIGNDLCDVSRPSNSDCIRCHNNSSSYRVNDAHLDVKCSICHSPHLSYQQHLLRGESNSLCTQQCHALNQLGRSHPRGQGLKDTNTGGEITCTSSCHRIHTVCTDGLLSRSGPLLCAQCHPDKL